MNHSSDLHGLFAEYANGGITNDQLQRLQAALRDNADLRRDFIEYMNLDSALGDLAALSEAEVAEFEAVRLGDKSAALAASDVASTKATIAGSRRVYRVAAIVGAVAAMLLLAAILRLANGLADKASPVATLVTTVDAALKYAGEPFGDAALVAGEYQLDQGLLHLQFDGGVMVYVEAPARFDAVSGKRVVLRSGRLSASVPPEGVGFTVETPEAEIIDFGTEFSVDVGSGASEVHVFEGLVRVKPRTTNDNQPAEAVDLRTSQAVKIEQESQKPVEIELATDRFIRSFVESRRKYARTVKRFLPVAFYRMAIRDQGLACVPPRYSGVVLTGDGNRPPHASGVFAGGSLRVLANSTGRGGRVDTPPQLRTGQFTLTAFVYLESRAPDGIVATNIQGDDGNFALSLDERGLLQATIRNRDGDLQSVSSDVLLPLQTWCHLVMTVDGEQLRVFEDSQLAASSPCSLLADSEAAPLWFGTDADGLNLWNGRIDEVALFDKALSDAEINDLYQAALEEMGKSK